MLESARITAARFRKRITEQNFQNIDKILIQYVIYAEASGVDIQFTYGISIKKDILETGLYHGLYSLSAVTGKGSFDNFLISLGKVIGKVPDTRKRLETDLVLGDKKFLTKNFRECPNEKFSKKWTNIMQRSIEAMEFRTIRKKPYKALRLEREIQRRKALLWSPILIEFDPVSTCSVRFTHNSMDKPIVWEKKKISCDIQTDLLTSFLNHMLWGSGREHAYSTVFVHKKAGHDENAQRIPIFVFTLPRFSTVQLSGEEAESFNPCNSKFIFDKEQHLADFINGDIYFQNETTASSKAGWEQNANLPSFLFIGDINDPTEYLEKALARKVRMYLSKATIAFKD